MAYKRDLSTPLAPTFGDDKPKRKVKRKKIKAIKSEVKKLKKASKKDIKSAKENVKSAEKARKADIGSQVKIDRLTQAKSNVKQEKLKHKNYKGILKTYKKKAIAKTKNK